MNANFNSLLLASIGVWDVVIPLACAVVGIIIGYFVANFIFNKIRAAKIGSAESVIAKMKEDAEQECKAIKKEAALEAKEQEIKLRHDFERETKEKRSELQKIEPQRQLYRTGPGRCPAIPAAAADRHGD